MQAALQLDASCTMAPRRAQVQEGVKALQDVIWVYSFVLLFVGLSSGAEALRLQA